MQMTSQQSRASAGRKTLGRSLSYVGHYPKVAIVAVVALLLATGAQLMVPIFIQNIIDAIVNSAAVSTVLGLPPAAQEAAAQEMDTTVIQLQTALDAVPRALIWAGIVVILFAIARGIFAFVQMYASQALSQNIAFDLRNDLFAKIQHLSFSYHDKNRTGQLMIRATDDVEKLRIFLGQGLLMTIQAFLLLFGTLTILMITNWRMTLIILPTLPIAFVLFMVFGAKAMPLFSEVQRRLSAVNTIVQENLTGLKVVKSFTSEEREEERFQESIDSLLEQQMHVTRFMALLFPLIFLIANLGQAAILYFGGLGIIEGTFTLGEWQKFSLYLTFVFIPMGQLGMIIALMAQATASSDRIFEILDTHNEVQDKPGAIDLGDIDGRVAFNNVSFRYFEHGENVLQDVSFVAEAGQTVALLGSTGSGKSTIINLIPRFYDVSEGSLSVDDQDVRDVTIASLREQIGIVLQESTLFGGTIRDNIAFGRPEASDEEVIEAAKAAAAHDFIVSFPDGYDTAVGERGSTLSGGQKQRVAIARALLMDPHILILDDSTSSVDLNTEYEIQKALDKLMERRTSFVIAQRISTVLNADQILVLENGRIVDRGVHEDLMENSAIYAEIYHSQLAEDVELT
jgi:ATP-binding cassette subfamily B protein